MAGDAGEHVAVRQSSPPTGIRRCLYVVVLTGEASVSGSVLIVSAV
jgi:hypothetical protein